MRRGWIIAGVSLLLLVGTLGLLAHRLLYTQAGLEFALRQLDRVPGLRIEVEGQERPGCVAQAIWRHYDIDQPA